MAFNKVAEAAADYLRARLDLPPLTPEEETRDSEGIPDITEDELWDLSVKAGLGLCSILPGKK